MHHYVIVRRDIPVGLQAAQITHAAGESARLSETLPAGTHAVTLHIHDEAAINELGRTLSSAGIKYASIVENDPPYENQLMAIGLSPQVRTPLIKKILGRYKTIK